MSKAWHLRGSGNEALREEGPDAFEISFRLRGNGRKDMRNEASRVQANKASSVQLSSQFSEKQECP